MKVLNGEQCDIIELSDREIFVFLILKYENLVTTSGNCYERYIHIIKK